MFSLVFSLRLGAVLFCGLLTGRTCIFAGIWIDRPTHSGA